MIDPKEERERFISLRQALLLIIEAGQTDEKDAAQWLVQNRKDIPFITYDEVLGIQIAPTEYTAIVHQGSGVLALDHLARTGEYFTEDGVYDESMPNPDFMGCCNPEFNHYGFDSAQLNSLIDELKNQSGYFDKTGASYTTPALKLLRRFIQAHWASFDPSEPAGATSKDDCIKWLTLEAEKMGIEKATNIINAIDLIARHPKAKAGNHQRKNADE